MARTALRRPDALKRKPVPVSTPTPEAVPPPPSTPPNPDDSELFINRELSLLEFQRRVLEEAKDPSNPLLERVKFLSIFSSNLDEFFMVRVAGLLKQLASGSQEVGLDSRSAGVQLSLIRQQVCQLAAESHNLWHRELRPALERAGIRILEFCRSHATTAHRGGYLFPSQHIPRADASRL